LRCNSRHNALRDAAYIPEDIREEARSMVDGEEEVFRETSEQGRWLSYDELGQIRWIGRPSAVKLAQRERWQRLSGNDRTARVLVPLDWLKPARRQPEALFREDFRDEFPEFSRIVGALEGELAEKGRAIAVLETAVATLREQLAQANGRVEAELRRVDQAEQATGSRRVSDLSQRASRCHLTMLARLRGFMLSSPHARHRPRLPQGRRR
jgi:hypothetical protein